MKISAVILAKNEENNIINCIESVSFCDEILVIDDFSTDRTQDVIKSLNNYKVVVHKSKLENFSQQRNHALQKAKGDYVLFIDADEVLSSGLKGEIEYAMENKTDISGFYLKRVDTLWGKQLLHGETGKMYLLRLAKKENGKWKGDVHEVWEVRGKTAKLTYPLYHNPHPSVKEFLSEINRYSTLRAQELHKKGIHGNWKEIILYPLGKFCYNFFLRLGILDGIQGFLLAIMMSLHSFLVRAKLYLLWNEK